MLKHNFIQNFKSNPCVYAFIPTIQLQSQILYIHPFKIEFHNQKSLNKCINVFNTTVTKCKQDSNLFVLLIALPIVIWPEFNLK